MKCGDGWTLFLDRDGTINRKPPKGQHVKSVLEFQFMDGVLRALEILSEKFDRIIVVTNQQGIGNGEMTDALLKIIHDFMLNTISANGGRIDAIYYCPHLEGTCTCRKPQTGLIDLAMRDFPSIDIDKSFVVGDSPADIKLAMNVGSTGVYIGGHEYPTLLEFAERLT